MDSISRSNFWKSRFVIEDSLFEYESIETRSITIFSGTQPMIVFESNWKTPNNISRIKVLSNTILVRSRKPAIGQDFSEVKKHIDKKLLNEFGDGVVGFVDKDNPQICYLMESPSEQSDLFYGISSIREVPDSLKLEQILVTIKQVREPH